MRFKIKQPPKKPKLGDTRNINKFAWKPTIVGNYKVWLESYQVTEQYKTNQANKLSDDFECVWVEIKRGTLDYYF